MSDIQIKGLAELQAALDRLPAKIEANIMRGAVRAGSKVIAEQAKQNVSKVSGTLQSTIKVGTRMKRGTAIGRVVAGAPARKGKASAFYARFVEFGTAAHVIAAVPGKALAIGGGMYKSVQHPGAKKKPFMRPAMDNSAQAALEATREYIRTRLADKHGIDVPAPIEEGDE